MRIVPRGPVPLPPEGTSPRIDRLYALRDRHPNLTFDQLWALDEKAHPDQRVQAHAGPATAHHGNEEAIALVLARNPQIAPLFAATDFGRSVLLFMAQSPSATFDGACAIVSERNAKLKGAAQAQALKRVLAAKSSLPGAPHRTGAPADVRDPGSAIDIDPNRYPGLDPTQPGLRGPAGAIDISSLPGRNITEQAINYLRSYLPAFAQLPWGEQVRTAAQWIADGRLVGQTAYPLSGGPR